MALGRVGPAAARVPGARHTSVSPGGRHRWAGPGLLCPQEEESPCGEVTLRRDHSLSEHDLVQLRSEVAAGLQPATQPPGGLGPPRPRAGSACAWRPSTQEQGKCHDTPPLPLCWAPCSLAWVPSSFRAGSTWGHPVAPGRQSLFFFNLKMFFIKLVTHIYCKTLFKN